MADMLKQADMMQTTIDSMVKMQSLTQQMTDDMHQMVAKMHSMTIDINELRDHMADFRGLLPAPPQLPLLGKALLRHPGVLVASLRPSTASTASTR